MSFKINPFTGEFDLVGEENNQPQITEETDPVFQTWLNSNPLAGFLTTETDPVFQAWLNSNPLANKQDKSLYFTNKVVLTTDFVADSTFAGYNYKANINCIGVTADMLCTVIFNPDSAISDNYCPVCTSSENTVTIYSRVIPGNNVNILTIEARK